MTKSAHKVVLVGGGFNGITAVIPFCSDANVRRRPAWEPHYRSWREGFRGALTDVPVSNEAIGLPA
jgi:hypothetical protein